MAFAYCGKLNTVLMSANIEVIGILAFLDCKNLESIELPDKDVLISGYAFENCVNLKSLNITGKTIVKGNPFLGCKGLADTNGFLITRGELYGYLGEDEDISIPSDVGIIAKEAFVSNKLIEKVLVHGNVSRIGERAFAKCKNLSVIVIEEGVDFIASEAFMNCTKLKEIILPDSTVISDDTVFTGCKGLADKQKLIIVRDTVYGYSGTAKTVTIPNGVETIGRFAFKGCMNLQTVYLPDSIKKIAWGAFKDCESLSTINFPDGLEEIDSSAFWGCDILSDDLKDNIERLRKSPAVERKKFIGNNSLADDQGLVIADGILYACCSKSTSITIQSSVRSIAAYAFDHNKTIKKVIASNGL